MRTFGELHLEFLDESGHVLIGDDGTLVFLNAEYAVGNLYFQVAFDLALATETPVLLDLFAGEMTLFRVKNFTTAFGHLAFALTATALTTTCRGKVNTFF